jgi:hypothetical protein
LITSRAKNVADVVETAERWQAAGGTQISVLTIKLGFDTAAAHLDFIAQVKCAVDTTFGTP